VPRPGQSPGAKARRPGGENLRTALVALAALALAAGAGGEPRVEAPAPTFLAREGGFRARFPEAPHYSEARQTTLLGTLFTRSWEVERGALRLRVERHDLPALATLVLGADGLLARAAAGLLADLDARGAREEAAALRQNPGRHLLYEPGDRPGETEDAWLYLLDRRLYVIFARGAGPETREAAAGFAASVELLEE
jgi:hypothetical protein